MIHNILIFRVIYSAYREIKFVVHIVTKHSTFYNQFVWEKVYVWGMQTGSGRINNLFVF